MLVMADARIDALIAEDVPYIDLTTELLGIGKNQGRMTYVTREDCIVAGTDVNRRIAQRLGLSVEQAVCDGARARAGSALMVVSGRASSLHACGRWGRTSTTICRLWPPRRAPWSTPRMRRIRRARS